MTEFHGQLGRDLKYFRDRILSGTGEILDPEGKVHHEFVKGDHGRKLDFDKVKTGGELYKTWTALYARAIQAIYSDRLPDALVGVANGANRLSRDIAPLLGQQILGLTTYKANARTVRLDAESIAALDSKSVELTLIIEDVSTTGSTIVSAANNLHAMGINCVEAIVWWQRTPALSMLQKEAISNHAVILEPLPTYSPSECALNPLGYCAQGVPLVAHS